MRRMPKGCGWTAHDADVSPNESNRPHRTAPGSLRLRRLTIGATQEEIAERAGISREQLVRLEAQTCAPSLRTALALAEALDADLLTLFPTQSGGERQLGRAPGSDKRTIP